MHHMCHFVDCFPPHLPAIVSLIHRIRMRVESLRVEIEKVWWQPLLKMLQDSFVITPKASLPTKEKEALKKAFGGFNTGFEQVFGS